MRTSTTAKSVSFFISGSAKRKTITGEIEVTEDTIYLDGTPFAHRLTSNTWRLALGAGRGLSGALVDEVTWR